jgi:hypothetical protein
LVVVIEMPGIESQHGVAVRDGVGFNADVTGENPVRDRAATKNASQLALGLVLTLRSRRLNEPHHSIMPTM